MSQDSIVSARLFLWSTACEAWGFAIEPPFAASSLSALVPGEVSFRATRRAVIGGESLPISLTVTEAWRRRARRRVLRLGSGRARISRRSRQAW
jgi:hypothetical protein